MKRQLVNDIPWPMIRNEIMDGSKMGGTEHQSIVVVLTNAMKMAGRKKLFKNIVSNITYNNQN